MSTLNDIKIALAKHQFEVISMEEPSRQLRIIGRILGGVAVQERWLIAVDHLIGRAEAGLWTIDPCKYYFRNSGRLRYAWRLIFQGNPIQVQYADLVATLATVPKPNRVELTEFTLPGANPGRRNSSGRVGPAGTVAVGPSAKRS